MRNDLLCTILASFFILCLLCLPASAFAADKIRQEKTMPEGGRAVLTFDTPLLTMTETPFTVELAGSTGKALADAAVSLSLVMPDMAMPLNNPKAIWLKDAYHGTAIFTMAGEWQAILIVQRPGHDLVELTFKLGEVLMK
jgi:hypothetical protein